MCKRIFGKNCRLMEHTHLLGPHKIFSAIALICAEKISFNQNLPEGEWPPQCAMSALLLLVGELGASLLTVRDTPPTTGPGNLIICHIYIWMHLWNGYYPHGEDFPGWIFRQKIVTFSYETITKWYIFGQNFTPGTIIPAKYIKLRGHREWVNL
jgi:hypothetical protein